MSIATEVQRISQAKADLKTAIESKEVTIKENATIDTYASKVDEVYSAGYEKGKAEGGGDSWYDEFWDSFQQNGNRTQYGHAFCLSGWDDTNFKPKYDIKPIGRSNSAENMFYNSRVTDLVALLDAQGVTLDTSGAYNFQAMFYGSKVTKIPIIDMSKCDTKTYVSNTFRTSTLQSIEKIILPTTNMVCDGTMFSNASSLTHVIFEGKIYQNFTINASTLDLESAKSVLLALENYAGTDKEFIYTLTLSAGTWEVLDADGATSPNGKTWREYANDIGWNVG